ncbi:cyclic GMP-AMP synthase-like [Hemitrygon akajei]|uniref:cyclic GMP-AMP synthase-like n=1 Tax=Hemitrygon akajei TaxID=2704970 RepID=UPI003BF95A39
MSKKKAPRGAGHLEIGTDAAKPARCGKATGAKPKGHRGEDPERRPGHSNGAGAENNSPANPGGKNRVGSEKYAGSGRSVGDNVVTTIPSKASGGNGNIPGRTAGQKQQNPSKDAGDKENIPGRAAVQKEKNPSRVAGDKGIIPGKAAVQKGKNSSSVVGDKGIIPGMAAGDKRNISGRTTRHKENITVKAAGDEGIIPDRVAAGKENISGRAAANKGNVSDGSERAEDRIVIRTPRTVSSEGSGDLSKLLKTVLESLRIRSDERSKASRIVNEVVDHLLRSIKKDRRFASIDKLPSGSYYEKVKISEPNEFDVMITVPVERIKYEEIDSEGAFYQVAFKRCPGSNSLASFVDDDGMLSAEKMLSELRKLIKDAVKSLTEHEIKMERKKSGSPAVTLMIEGDSGHEQRISLDMVLALEVKSQSWPPSTTNGLRIEKWLGNKVRSEFRQKPFYLVPKQQPLENTEGVQIESQKEMWRISFSHIEKMMIMNHGSAKICCENKSPKCCRKSCLKLLKNLIGKLKEKHPRILAYVCSYHAKTTLLHACIKRPSDDMWRLEDLARCFLQLLDDFTECLKKADLPHFFIPSYNFFDSQKFDSKDRTRLLDFIERERAKNFPIFGINLQSQ